VGAGNPLHGLALSSANPLAFVQVVGRPFLDLTRRTNKVIGRDTAPKKTIEILRVV